MLAVLEWDGKIIATAAVHAVREWLEGSLSGNGGMSRR